MMPLRLVRLALVGLVVLAALAVPAFGARPAYASHCDEDHSVLGGNYVLREDETLDRNLVVLGGTAAIEAGATVECSVVIVGGEVDIAGTVEEDVVVFGGSVDLESSAVVEGALASIGGTVRRAEGAVVEQGESQGFGFDPRRRFGFPFWPGLGLFDPVFGLWRAVLEAVFTAVALGLLALLVTLFWPEQTARAAAAITAAPVAAGGLGLLTLIAVPVLIVAAILTLCLLPVGLLGVLLYAAAILFGWLALGQVVGLRLVTALRLQGVTLAVATALGTAALSLAVSAINWVPCLGWIVSLILAALGLGAVMLTRFGTRPYLPTLRPPPPAEPAAPPAPPVPG